MWASTRRPEVDLKYPVCFSVYKTGSLHSPGRPGIQYVDRAGLKLPEIHLPITQSAGIKSVCHNSWFGALFDSSPLYFLQHSVLLNSGPANLGRLASQFTPGIPCMYLPSTRMTSGYHTNLALDVDYGYQNSDSQTYRASILLTEPTSQTHNLLYKVIII